MGMLSYYLLSKLSRILFIALVLIIALPAHEISHALAAYIMGDKTAKNMGRLSLNPLKHLDPIGTLCLLLFSFGWAKPVPVNPYNFKNRKGGMAVTALAGPLANLILAFVSIIFKYLLVVFGVDINTGIYQIIYSFLLTSAYINIGLCLFNLLPIPPLDGADILLFFFPETLTEFFNRYAMYFQIFLLVLLVFPILTNPLSSLVSNVYNNLNLIASALFGFFAA